jgi:uncharacterized protein YbjQ (UPF0145 family)
MDIILQYPDLFIFLFLACLGYGAGSWVEKRHYASIKIREKQLLNLPVVTGGKSFCDKPVEKSVLVTGSVVVSIDYFKRLLAILRNIFGGPVKSYESLVDRARREAILRMKETASQLGADIIINLRLETAAIGKNANRKRQIGSVEVIAYGTALVYSDK